MAAQPRPIFPPSSLELAALPNAVASARRHTCDVLPKWGFADLVESCELLVSELVTNAVKASGIFDHPIAYPELHDRLVRVRLRLFATETSVFIEVWDPSLAKPVVVDQSLVTDSGRGMFLVEAISKRWNVYYPKAGGKIVWCEVSRVDH